ncbi:hypothetical protein, partial [Mycolicibacterium insubricum]|uniref:hypothetical protein n=1 Tax=Mycolicibacterium insubricum TaxID=444597 RepID=UPI0021F28710
YARIDAPADREQKARLSKLSAEQVGATELAGEPITAKLTAAPARRAEDQRQEELGPRAPRAWRPRFFEISDLSPDGPTSSLRLECFLVRDDGQRRAYGVNSALQG